ncbi:hypothetical protein [Cupriavidus necator]|uniref:hypothetical protein n=1 Tax=Cupriavidus necator TaxID=106590 RepID=UPI003F735C17
MLTITTLFLLGCFLFISKNEAKNHIRAFLESDWPSVVIWLLATIGVGANTFLGKSSKADRPGFIYQSFGEYADAVFAVATFGFAGSTSLALLKGLYLQIFFNGSFFNGFGNFDLASMFVVSSFMLFYSVNGTLRQIIEVVFQAEAAELASA